MSDLTKDFLKFMACWILFFCVIVPPIALLVIKYCQWLLTVLA